MPTCFLRVPLPQTMTWINCYLVREEDGLTLIDTGFKGAARYILKAVEAEGQPLRRVVITHAHPDHIAGLDEINSATPGLECIISAREHRILMGDRNPLEGEVQVQCPNLKNPCRCEFTRLVQPGDTIGSLRVIAAGGHTPGSIALFDERDRTLFVGDAWQTMVGLSSSGHLGGFPLPAIASWHRPSAKRAAHALIELNPARLAPGHGRILEEPFAAMQTAIQRETR